MWKYWLGALIVTLGYVGHKIWHTWRNYDSVIQILEDKSGIEEWHERYGKSKDRKKTG